MQDETTTGMTEWSNSVECCGCDRRLYVAPYPIVNLPAVAAKVGWRYRATGETACEECSPGVGIEEAMGQAAFAPPLVDEDKAPKQTEQEAAQAYDAETVERFKLLLVRLRYAAQITEVAFEVGAEAYGVLKCAVDNPEIKHWGEDVRGERGQATREEAL